MSLWFSVYRRDINRFQTVIAREGVRQGEEMWRGWRRAEDSFRLGDQSGIL